MSSMSNADLVNVLHFFDRFTNPIFVPKGVQQDVFFDVPAEYYPKDYKHLANAPETAAKKSSSSKIITVKKLRKEPDLSIAKLLAKKDHFTLFNPRHEKVAGELIRILLEASTDELISTCAYLNLSEVNPYAFEYALSVAIAHREDTKFIPLPSSALHAPEFYFNGETIKTAETEASIVVDPKDRNAVRLKLPRTGTNQDPEHRLWYWREDIGINLHHWHWHVIYPFSTNGSPNEKKIVGKDRRGELFYYMHSQMMARYNTERLCNRLNRTKSFIYFDKEIPEIYFSKLSMPFTSKHWASRHANSVWSDINREGMNFSILDLELYRQRILGSIHNGYILDGEKLIPFDEKTGIDDLGNIVEASVLSKNRSYYGPIGLHNSGHITFAFLHDPENIYLENMGPMGDNRTAVRDPVFLRWHSMIDDIFVEYKKTLPDYTTELEFPGVSITSAKVTTQKNTAINVQQDIDNHFYTFMQLDEVNLAYGLDVSHKGEVNVWFPHLQNSDFTYNLTVSNSNSKEITGTFRIFLAPVTDETETKKFDYNVQRRYMIELDKFTYKIPAGAKDHPVSQSSQNSSVTIPFNKMFADIETIMDNLKKHPGAAGEAAYCGCGWPHHMLLPRGTQTGFKCKLFFMITDFDIDNANKKPSLEAGSAKCKSCTGKLQDEFNATAASFCGLREQNYPDTKPMGFPFDRQFTGKLNPVLNDFINKRKNMYVIEEVIITFVETPEPINGPTITGNKPDGSTAGATVRRSIEVEL